MAWQIVIDFDPTQGSSTFIHQLRNFGEDLWRACKEDGWASIDLADVDRATNQLTVTVSSSRRVRRTVAMTNKLLERHFLASYASVTQSRIDG